MIRFGSFELDPARWELRSRGSAIALQPKPFKLLLHLVEQRARVVSKHDLFEAVWPGVIVSDAALSTTVRQLRQALGSHGGNEDWILTLRGLGYRFIGPVEESSEPSLAVALAHGRMYGVPRGISMSFVGRSAELAELEARLRQQHVSVQASVEGLAGVGKTELALQLVHKLAHEGAFAGGIFWIDAEQPDLRHFWGEIVADHLGVTAGSTDERCERVLRAVSELRNPVLVVLDNVSSWSSTARPRPLPEGAQVRVLVTTRERALGGPQFAHVELGFLAPPHDRALVEGIAGHDVEPGLDALLEYLAGHALGLELAGTFLAMYPGESAQSYLEALRNRDSDAEQEASTRVRCEQTVSGALRSIWDRLGAAERSAWQLVACFEPEHVSRRLADAVALDAAALRALERVHLVRSTQGGGWIMHRLTRAFGQRAGTPEQLAEARRQFVRGCMAVSASSHAPMLERYLPDRVHVDAALRMAEETPELQSEWSLLERMNPFYLDQRNSAREVADLSLEQAVSLLRTADSAESFAPVITRLSFVCFAKCIVGCPDQAQVLADEVCRFVLPSGLPARVLDALGLRQLAQFVRHDVDGLERDARRRLELATTHDFAVTAHISRLLLAWASFERGTLAPRQAFRVFFEETEHLDALGFDGGRMLWLEFGMRACVAAGAAEEIARLVAWSFEYMETTGRHWLEPEFWRYKALVASGPDERIACLERALEIAEKQQALWWALRAASDRVEVAADRSQKDRAIHGLRTVCSKLREGFQTRDWQRAVALLERERADFRV